LGGVRASVSADAQIRARVDFARDVEPILRESCVGCHGPEQQLGGFRLDQRTIARGINRIRPGSSATSRVYLRISGREFGQQMPPNGALSADAINIIKRWIDEGAEWPDALAGDMSPPPAPDPAVEAMRIAIRNGDRAAFAATLARNPQAVNRSGETGATPLMFASLYADAAAVRSLLANGADPNLANRAGATALMWAITDESITRLLLDGGANPTAADAQGVQPLTVAAGRSGGAAVVRLLLEKGASASGAQAGRGRSGGSAVQQAASAGDEALFRLIAERGGDLQGAPWQALADAAATDCAACFDRLLGSMRPSELNAALVVLAGLDQTPLITRLIDRGADVNAKVTSLRRDLRGRTPLMVAASSDYVPTATVQLLLDRGADVKTIGPDSETALDLAKRNGQTPVVDLLVAAGASGGKGYPRPAMTPNPAASPRAALERVVPLLQRSAITFVRNTGCAACHHNVHTNMTLAALRAHRIPVDEDQAREHLKAMEDAVGGRRDTALLGNELNDVSANLLMGLAVAGHAPDFTTDAMAHSLRLRQQSDGRWRPLVIDHRPPINTGEIEVTAVSIRALRAYAPPCQREQYDRAIARAVAWLGNAKPRTTDERAFRLLGLVWSGVRPDDNRMRNAVRQILLEQQPDGGWSQLPTLKSDPHATGQTLVALHEAGIRTTEAAYQRGVRYLMNTQLQDGTWYVQSRALAFQPYFESGFPHGPDQWISNAATNWAAMALAFTVGDAVNGR
jgi:ankyrin repeat protein